ncbi:MAG: crotonase/enoyl-CoA hydratase family protein [Candidatus Geothermincolales bacterium]
MEVKVERRGPVYTVIINRPEVRNAIDPKTAGLLAEAFREFARDDGSRVAVLWGAGGTFCAGADLKSLSRDPTGWAERLRPDMDDEGPLGPTRMLLPKPVIAAISGYCVAGGMELALWCDLRVAEEDAVLGFFDRRFGVPLIDGGTYRLPRLIGLSRALDLILTGRPVSAREAYEMGLVNRLVPRGKSREEAEALAVQLSSFPQTCMLKDRASAYRAFDLDWREALSREFEGGMEVIASGETLTGATRFAEGEGRHGQF